MAAPPAKRGGAFRFSDETLAELSRHGLAAEPVEHLRLACEKWSAPIHDDTESLRAVANTARSLALALDRAVDEQSDWSISRYLLGGPDESQVWDGALIFALRDPESRMLRGLIHGLANGVDRTLSRRPGKTPTRVGRRSTRDWLLPAHVAAISLHNGMNVSATAEGSFMDLMTTVWYAVGRVNLPTHAVRTMLKHMEAGRRITFQPETGKVYFLSWEGCKLKCWMHRYQMPAIGSEGN